MESMELWGLTKGSVSGLYSILFSSQPVFHLQFAAFSLLLSEPFCQLSLIKDSSLGENYSSDQQSDISRSAELMPDSEKTLCLRDELSALVEFPTSELLKTDLTTRDRVCYIYIFKNLLEAISFYYVLMAPLCFLSPG
jgi:hypothetical protein